MYSYRARHDQTPAERPSTTRALVARLLHPPERHRNAPPPRRRQPTNRSRRRACTPGEVRAGSDGGGVAHAQDQGATGHAVQGSSPPFSLLFPHFSLRLAYVLWRLTDWSCDDGDDGCRVRRAGGTGGGRRTRRSLSGDTFDFDFHASAGGLGRFALAGVTLGRGD